MFYALIVLFILFPFIVSLFVGVAFGGKKSNNYGIIIPIMSSYFIVSSITTFAFTILMFSCYFLKNQSDDNFVNSYIFFAFFILVILCNIIANIFDSSYDYNYGKVECTNNVNNCNINNNNSASHMFYLAFASNVFFFILLGYKLHSG